jgi:hypothetical protein
MNANDIKTEYSLKISRLYYFLLISKNLLWNLREIPKKINIATPQRSRLFRVSCLPYHPDYTCVVVWIDCPRAPAPGPGGAGEHGSGRSGVGTGLRGPHLCGQGRPPRRRGRAHRRHH